MRRTAFAALAALLTPLSVSADLWIVDPGGGGHFTTIQEALGAAATGDEIAVNPGHYSENLDFLGKNLWLHSAAGPAGTVIDGSQGGPQNRTCVTFQLGETRAAILEGFTITGGQGTPDYLRGGGVRCVGSAPTLRGCWIVGNHADHGAGLYLDNAGPLVEACVFRNNVATRYGGAINGSGCATIADCLFQSNFAGEKGGAIASGAMQGVIADCRFVSNLALLDGGAIELAYSASPHILNCTFIGNKAMTVHGGAIRTYIPNPLIEGCLFAGNWAAADGGAVMTHGGWGANILGCTFFANGAGRYGGHVAIYDGGQVSHSILAEATEGGGLFCDGGGVFFECLDAWGNAGGNYVGIPDPTGTNGNIAADPLFCDVAAQDFTIREDSPCAPPQNPTCGLIGALGVGCSAPTPTVSVTWGQIKSLYAR